MKNSDDVVLSRRQCLQQLSLSGLAASLGPGLPGATVGAAQRSVSQASGDGDLGARIYNIRDFGAKGDGITLDTAAVQGAIDACNKDQGGTVLVPAGVFVIGTNRGNFSSIDCGASAS